MDSSDVVSTGGLAVSRFLSRVCVGADPDSYSGKRDATRYTEGAPMEVMLNPKRPSRISNVYMHNASEGGCAFWFKKKIESRSTVYIRACAEEGVDPWVKAHCTHCTVGIRGYLVGVAFEV
jgi:hypothetical protein